MAATYQPAEQNVPLYCTIQFLQEILEHSLKRKIALHFEVVHTALHVLMPGAIKPVRRFGWKKRKSIQGTFQFVSKREIFLAILYTFQAHQLENARV